MEESEETKGCFQGAVQQVHLSLPRATFLHTNNRQVDSLLHISGGNSIYRRSGGFTEYTETRLALMCSLTSTSGQLQSGFGGFWHLSTHPAKATLQSFQLAAEVPTREPLAAHSHDIAIPIGWRKLGSNKFRV